MIVKDRKDIALEDTWDLSSLYKDDQSWEKSFQNFEKKLVPLDRYPGKLNNAEKIREYLDLEMALEKEMSNLFNYASLRRSEDTRAEVAQSMYARAYRIYVQLNMKTSFFRPEVLSMDEDALQALTQAKILAPYARLMQRLLAEKAHTLSKKEENIIASLGEVMAAPGEIADNLMDADLLFPDVVDQKGEKHALSGSTYIRLQASNDRTLRENSFRQMYKTYKEHINTFAAAYTAQIKATVTEASLRHYSSSRAMEMSRNEIPEQVYDNLIATVREHLPTMYRYERLRKRLLGLRDLHYYDLYAPLLQGSEKEYTYAEAKQIVLDTVSVLGKDYQEKVEEAFENRWVDVYPNKGKSGGAYSSGTYDSNPYIMMNFSGTLDSVSTLAHEMGHSMHSYHSNHHQPFQYADYTLFVAEVASTVNENLLIENLLGHTSDPKERLVLLNQYLEGFKGTIYRQTMFAEFEKKAHALAEQGEALNATTLSNIYEKLVKDYFGDDLVWDDEIRYEWARIPHFYRPFYVYVYATGYSTAVALSEKILHEKEPAVKKYREFLAMGNAEKPLAELQHAGVDLTTPEPIHTALMKFSLVLDEAERIADLLEKE